VFQALKSPELAPYHRPGYCTNVLFILWQGKLVLILDFNVTLGSKIITLQQFNSQHKVAKTHLKDYTSLIIFSYRVEQTERYLFSALYSSYWLYVYIRVINCPLDIDILMLSNPMRKSPQDAK
jgi:hypothetical protein